MKYSKRMSSSALIFRRWSAFAFLCSFFLVGQGVAKQPPSMKVPQSCFFVANEGQWEEPFAFKLSAGAATYFVTPEGLTIDVREYERPAHASQVDEFDPFERQREPEPVSVRGHVLKVNFVRPAEAGRPIFYSPEQGLQTLPESSIHGEDKLASYSNYFIGRDSCNWRSRVGHYQRVVMKEVWGGIDVEFRAQPNGVETVYHVKPGADPSQIVIEYEGLDAPLRTDFQGNLILATSLGNLTEKAPWAYQIINNRQPEVPIEFQIIGDSRCTLNPQSFDRTKELVIDPLIYGSYIAAGMYTNDFAYDNDSNLVMTGSTSNSLFPTTTGAYQSQLLGLTDWFVSKWRSDGRELSFSTYIGGSGEESSRSIAITSTNNFYLGGITSSHDWPLSNNAIISAFAPDDDGAFCCLLTDGTELLYSSYFGPQTYDGIPSLDEVSEILMDTIEHKLYITGFTRATNFYFSPNALYNDTDAPYGAYVSIFDPASNEIVYSTLFPSLSGGTTTSSHIEILSSRRIWLTGSEYSPLGGIPLTPDAFDTVAAGSNEGFFALLDLSVPEIEYCSYIGGVSNESCRLTVIDSNRILLYGSTRSSDFPHTEGAPDTTIEESEIYFTLLELPTTLLSSTFLGGAESDGIRSLIKASDGSFIGCGQTFSEDFPLTDNAFDSSFGGGTDSFSDGWMTVVSNVVDSFRFSSYVGGSEPETCAGVLQSSNSLLWLTGYTESPDFPITPDAYEDQLQGFFTGYLLRLDTELDFEDAADPKVPLPQVEFLAYPNPFNSSCNLHYSISQSGPLRLTVFDVLGRQIIQQSADLVAPGAYDFQFNAEDLGSGSYFVVLKSNNRYLTKRIVLSK